MDTSGSLYFFAKIPESAQITTKYGVMKKRAKSSKNVISRTAHPTMMIKSIDKLTITDVCISIPSL